MRKLCTLFLLISFFSCSKEELARNLVVSAMTGGQWKVVSYISGTTDLSSDFLSYQFQFRENLTVDALNNAIVEKTGSWTADANARTITSTFSNASMPLVLLNGTWKITNNSWTFVEASQIVNGETRSLRLEKV